MELPYKQPKLKDSLFGEMVWNEWDEDEAVWFSRMKDVQGTEFMLFIHANSSLDFFAPRNTHKLYKQIIEDISLIRSQAIEYALKNSKLLQKRKDRNRIGKFIEQSTNLFSVEFHLDLSSEICWQWRLDEEEDSMITAIMNPNGGFIESYISEA